MEQKSFFVEQTPRSAVKTDIVTKYFQAWAKILGRKCPAIAYVDLFAGSGVYEDGVESTPIRILKMALANQNLHDKLITVFNDENAEAMSTLRKSINDIDEIGSLKHPPKLLNEKVGGELVRSTGVPVSIPTLSFIDPFGYLGVSQSLIDNAMRAWGSECVLFFNYNRINLAIDNPVVRKHVDALFTSEVAEDLRRLKAQGATPAQREASILEGLTKSLGVRDGRHLLFFRFRALDKDRTSHYIVHMSKHRRGYFIMRDVMAGASAVRGGIPLFEWSPKEAEQLSLSFHIDGAIGIPELKRLIIGGMRGRTVRAEECYEEVTLGTPYLRKHFTKAVDELDLEGKVSVSKPRQQRRRNGQVTLGKDVVLVFPN